MGSGVLYRVLNIFGLDGDTSSSVFSAFLVSFFIALVILFDLLEPGYIILLDRAAGPNPQAGSFFFGLVPLNGGYVPFHSIVLLISKLVPYWVVQKAFIFFIFFLMGMGAFRLLDNSSFGRFYGLLLYTINPFTYVRFLSGQLGVLMAYAILPFALKTFLDFLDVPDRRSVTKLVLLTTAVGFMQVQGFGLALLLYATIFLAWLYRRSLPDNLPKPILPDKLPKSIAVFLIGFFLLNIYWIIPLLSNGVSNLDVVSEADLIFFSPDRISDLGVLFDVAAMYGFWRTGFPPSTNTNSVMMYLFPLILYFAVRGYLNARKEENGWFADGLALAAVVAFILAVGTASGYTRPLFVFLWDTFPPIRAFRDSQKLVSIILLAYVYFGAEGVNAFIKELKHLVTGRRRLAINLVTALLVLSPIVYTSAMPLGFSDQVEPTFYPEEWHEVNDLTGHAKESQVLLLPWHQYMDYSWLPNRDKRTGPLAKSFFDVSVIAGDNLEIPRAYSQSNQPVSKYVEFVMGVGPTMPHTDREVANLGELLVPLNVKYVLVTKEVDWKRYDKFLQEQKDLELVLENKMFRVYENTHEVSRSYGVDEVRYVKGWSGFLNRSRTEDVTEAAYVVNGSRAGESVSLGPGGREVLETEEIHLAKYRVDDAEEALTVFTQRQDTSYPHWSLNGREPRYQMLGFVPVFESVQEGETGTLRYERFYWVYLPSYAVSLLTFIALVGLYLRPGLIEAAGRKIRDSI